MLTKKIIVFGTGDFSRRFLFVQEKVSYYVDNNELKWGTVHQGKKVYSPEQLLKEKKSEIIIAIASMYYEEIAKQLSNVGFLEGKHFFNGDEILLILNSEEYKKVEIYKDKHQGKRAFIIGNGPSLKYSDLDLIKNEISYASNQVYLAFTETIWRPTYYTIMDVLVARNIKEDVRQLTTPKFCSHRTFAELGNMENTFWLNEKALFDEDKNRMPPMFSHDLSRVIYDGSTVTYFNLQLACYMGIKEIYLLGVDFDYPGVPLPSKNGGNYANQENHKSAHFHPNYHTIGEINTIPRLHDMYSAYQSANKFLLNKGVRVYNATRNTKLDVFPLVKLEDILC